MNRTLLILVLASCSKKEEDAPKIAGGDPDEGGQIAPASTATTTESPPPPPTAAPAPVQPPTDPYKVGATRFPGRHQIVPNMKLGPIKQVGKLPEPIVPRIVRQHFQQLRYCYEQWLRDDNTAKGNVTVHFVIAASGAVVSAEVTKKLHDSVDQCVVERFLALEFPKPEQGTVDVTITLEFSETD